ncbi:hypothetical protein AVEN_201805-1, partial [Araneus ventricosus]
MVILSLFNLQSHRNAIGKCFRVKIIQSDQVQIRTIHRLVDLDVDPNGSVLRYSAAASLAALAGSSALLGNQARGISAYQHRHHRAGCGGKINNARHQRARWHQTLRKSIMAHQRRIFKSISVYQRYRVIAPRVAWRAYLLRRINSGV